MLVWLPSALLRRSGVRAPDAIGALQIVGVALVVEEPYQWVRNPMYLGAMVSLLGAAVYYASVWLLAYLAAFALWAHLFVVGYEEPHFRRTFGDDYAAYAARVRRWLPGQR